MTTQANPTKRFFFPSPASAENKRLFFPQPVQVPAQQKSSEKTAAFLAEGLRKPHKLMKKLKSLVLAQA
jgi:hypothetical protein